MKHRAFIFCTCFFFAQSVLYLAACGADLEPGSIACLRVVGNVSKCGDDGLWVPVANQSLLVAGTSIKTDREASVLLLFESGPIVFLYGETKISIDDVKKEPPNERIRSEILERRPIHSTTILRLEHGRVIAQVPELSDTAEFSMESPLGIVKARSTAVFLLSYRLKPNDLSSPAEIDSLKGVIAFHKNSKTETVVHQINERHRLFVNDAKSASREFIYEEMPLREVVPKS